MNYMWDVTLQCPICKNYICVEQDRGRHWLKRELITVECPYCQRDVRYEY